MAWIEQRGGQFHIGIRIGNQKVKRSLQTNDRDEAEDIKRRVERRLKLIQQGDLTVPPDADAMTFLLTDGKVSRPATISVGVTLGQLCSNYLESIPQGTIERNTEYTLKIHLNHFRRVLGDRFRTDRIEFEDLQRYVNTRSKEDGSRGKPISPVTIRKELTSVSGLWAWAIRAKHLKATFPNKGLRFPKAAEKPPFQTRPEIERQIEAANLTAEEQSELWERLFLNTIEIEQTLDYIEKHATIPAIYPMVALAAHTGARRSEILRAELADFDFTAMTVRLRELKRAKGKRTMRTVPMSGRLHRVLEKWTQGLTGRFAFAIGGRQLTVDEASHHFKQTLKDGRWNKIRGWHVLRHSFISNCASQGIDQRMIDAWTGHQTEEMRKRYRHLFPEGQLAALRTVFGR